MILLKIYLLIGLITHKAIWEVLRTRTDEKPKESQSIKLIAIKTIKISILLGIIIQTVLPFDLFPITNEPVIFRIVGVLIFTIGLSTAVAARIQLGDNWSNIETGQVLQNQEVVKRGIYGWIRHPIYTGDIFLLLGLELALNSWLFLGVFLLAPVVMLKAIKEEQMLVKELAGYDSYQTKTKRFIPYII